MRSRDGFKPRWVPKPSFVVASHRSGTPAPAFGARYLADPSTIRTAESLALCLVLVTCSLVALSFTQLSAVSGPSHEVEGRLNGVPSSIHSVVALPRTSVSPHLIAVRDSTSNAVSIVAEYWAGYVYCPMWYGTYCGSPGGAADVEGVEASWILSAVTNTSPLIEDASTWVGIGGVGTNDLIQAGTDGTVAFGEAPSYSVWWEMLPAGSVGVTLAPNPQVAPGNLIFVKILFGGNNGAGDQLWRFTIQDNSTHSSWTGTEACGTGCTPSSFSSADWIEESPELGTTIVQLPAFTAAEVRGAEFLNATGTWSDLNMGLSTVLDFSLQNPSYSAAVLGLVSSIYSDGTFWFQYLVDTADLMMSGRSGDLSGGVSEPGQPLLGELNLSSPDSFGSSSATALGVGFALTLGSQQVCAAATNISAGFGVSTGISSIPVRADICRNVTNGGYAATLSLWYVPLGQVVGSPGSLPLAEQPEVSAMVVVDGPVVSRPVISPPSATLDLGQAATLSVNVSGGSPPYWIDWIGLPTGCLSENASHLSCLPTLIGGSSISATAVDSIGVASTSASQALTVLPDPSVQIVVSSSHALEGVPVTIASFVVNGSTPYTFSWTGLPSGCQALNQSAFSCSPSSFGSYSIQVRVVDHNGWMTESNATLVVDPAIFGVSVWVVLPIVALIGLLVVSVLLGRPRRNRRTLSNRDGQSVEETRLPGPPAAQAPYGATSGPAPGSRWQAGLTEESIVSPVRFEEPPGGTAGLDPGSVSMGTPLINPPERVCWHCHFENPPGSRYCVQCGLPLEPPPPAGSASS